MIYKVVFDNGKKGVMVVADGKGEARKKAKAKYKKIFKLNKK